MPTRKSPRKGSLQYWPRKRAAKLLPSVNWGALKDSPSKNLMGFICYKAGMKSAVVKDNTPNSLTKNKKISIPVTLLECPPLRILSVRFYKNNKLVSEVLASPHVLDKELKRKLKFPKKAGKIEDIAPDSYNDIRVIVYSVVKKTGLKKKPDLAEVGLHGALAEKLSFAKEKLGKEISVTEVFEKSSIVDVRGLTKGKGLQGPVKRFGIKLKVKKSEKGQRRPGSIGPWNPSRVTFRVPMSGQLGMFSRVTYNLKILDLGKAESREEFSNLHKFGNIKTDYILLRGSVQGPRKRQLLLTCPLRKTKKQEKKEFELLELK